MRMKERLWIFWQRNGKKSEDEAAALNLLPKDEVLTNG